MRIFVFLLLLAATAAAAQTPDGVTTAVAMTPAVAITPPICPIRYYPPAAIRANEEGTVTLTLTVTAQGGVKDLVIQTSSGFKDLDDATLICAKDWQFTPATKNGVPVETSKKYMIDWSLFGPKLDLAPIVSAVQKCITPSAPDDDELKAKIYTQIDIQSDSGIISHVVVTPSSGYQTLDERMMECMRQATPKMSSKLSGRALVFSR